MSAPPRGLTAEEFAALRSDGLRLELVRGEIIAMAPAFGDHGTSAMQLGIILGQYVMTHQLGRMYAAETGFLLARDPDIVRAPDLAFIQASRLSPSAAGASWVPIVPDLVAEVVSSGDRPAEVGDKIQMWLDAGVRLVWVVSPPRQTVEVYRRDQPVITLGIGDQLDGADVVPGFATPVAQIFA